MFSFSLSSLVPKWLSIVVAFIPLPPQLAWIKPLLEGAYLIYQDVPWFHKPKAMYELRQATKVAVNNLSPTAMRVWHDRWHDVKSCATGVCPMNAVVA